MFAYFQLPSCPRKVLWSLVLLLSVCFAAREGLAQGQDSLVTVAAGKHYLKNAFHRFWWGKHYRQVWAEPVQVPLFWISRYKGGMTPQKEGGSFQTKNLRLLDQAGREYVLRSIDKDPTGALPRQLQRTFVARLLQDQTSVIHPYGAFIVPTLAAAAGVYHTNPRLVYIADDPDLGEFRAEFAHMLALLEERPDGNWETLGSFGNPRHIVSSKTAFEHLVQSPRYQAEARRYLTSRLFDMWLSDWSRREDQWRWAQRERGERVEFSPIPRDRDHAFFKFKDGVLTGLISVFKPNYQSFDQTISPKNVKGLMRSSRQMDASLLAYLPKETFREVARELQMNLSDEVIEEALQQWPAQIRALTAREFATKLRNRRADLPRAAEAFYRQINRHLLLPGTDAEDLFRLTFQEDGRLLVQVWGTVNQEQRLFHQKTFTPADTKSISFFGLGDEDRFELAGSGRNRIKLQLYGGQDTDQLRFGAHFRIKGKKPLVLEEEDGNQYPAHKKVKQKKYTPAAREFDGAGWLLRHRLH
ncbi:hypothetical protein [Rufibacter psychrotolerans]|uniref:hypothetical protein n=1 Tax=Rufibacter psychrotolerans TaxID=2812556 RepID=UPI001967E554|nr:hypothetical protein [Rufibacter sp. SYSU D00308]